MHCYQTLLNCYAYVCVQNNSNDVTSNSHHWIKKAFSFRSRLLKLVQKMFCYQTLFTCFSCFSQDYVLWYIQIDFLEILINFNFKKGHKNAFKRALNFRFKLSLLK